MIISAILLLIIIPQYSISLFRESYNNILNKSKSYYKSAYEKQKPWSILGSDPSEYPGRNIEYIKINKKKWDEYYNCLKLQTDSLGTDKTVTPEAVVAFEGTSVSFDCKLCLNPKEYSDTDSVEWYWASLYSQEFILIEYTEHILISPEEKSLHLYNLHENQNGQYICTLGQALTVPYFLTVINTTSNTSEVHAQYAQHGPYPQAPETIKLFNLTVDTVWDNWTHCSKCDKIGKRYRVGYCTIFYNVEIPTFNTTVATTTEKFHISTNKRSIHTTIRRKNKHNAKIHTFDSTVMTTTKKFNISTIKQSINTTITPKNKHHVKIHTFNSTVMTTTDKFNISTIKQVNKKITKSKNEVHTNHNNSKQILKDLELFKIFQNSIPCQSHILPESIKNIQIIKKRKNEVMVGYCKVRCPEKEMFVVKDKNGNIIEQANNSAGIYSMLQGMPNVDPPIERMLQYAIMGKHTVISCPGNLNRDTPIQWQIGLQKLVPDIIAKLSKGRISISIMNRINIKKTKLSDSNTYSCWQNKDLAGIVRLVVEKKIQLTFNHHIMLFGMIIIISVFLYVFTKAFFGRKYAENN